jgi:2-polyprenyl-3-methyl-5-hydroxy-6-metoxy-1,4-benzoquinol methylase
MTREEHYRRAETLLLNAWQLGGPEGDTLIHTPERRAELIATAHVHALLATADRKAAR